MKKEGTAHLEGIAVADAKAKTINLLLHEGDWIERFVVAMTLLKVCMTQGDCWYSDCKYAELATQEDFNRF